MTQLKLVLLCALVHSFLRFEERIEIIRQNPKLLPNWYRSCLALLPLYLLAFIRDIYIFNLILLKYKLPQIFDR